MRPLLILLLCLSAVAQSSKQHAANKQSFQKEIERPEVNQPVADTRSSATTQFYTYNNRDADRNETVKEIGDGLLVVFTAALVCVGWGQWRTLREHEKWMRKNVEVVTKVASAAKDGADAALLNAKAVIRSERPWIIGAEGDDGFKLFSNPALVPKFSLAIKNSGRTPGRLVRVLMRFEKRASLDGLRGFEHDLDIANICPVPYVLIIPRDVPFKVSATITGDQPITIEEMGAVRDGKLFLVAYGVIEYEDVFDAPDNSHKSGFFFYYAYGGPVSHGFQTYYSAPSDYLQVT
jgi:hypothetical protein